MLVPAGLERAPRRVAARHCLVLVFLGLLTLAPGALAQVIPNPAVETAHVHLTPPFLLRPVPGTTLEVPVKVSATLECSGAQPEDLQLYIGYGKAFTESDGTRVRELWRFEPEVVKVPWRLADGRYMIEADAMFRLVSTDAPTVDREHGFRVSLTGTSQNGGTCPGGHVVWWADGQGAIVMDAPQKNAGAQEAAGPTPALVTGVLVACAILYRRRR